MNERVSSPVGCSAAMSEATSKGVVSEARGKYVRCRMSEASLKEIRCAVERSDELKGASEASAG